VGFQFVRKEEIKVGNIVEFKGYKIKLFHNSGGWDYFISGITGKNYPARRALYETEEEAIEKAKIQINNREA